MYIPDIALFQGKDTYQCLSDGLTIRKTSKEKVESSLQTHHLSQENTFRYTSHWYQPDRYKSIYLHACMLRSFSRVWLCATPWTVALQAPLSMGFSRQENWSRLQCPLSGDLPDPGIKPESPASPALQADSLPLSHWGSPYINITILLKKKFS